MKVYDPNNRPDSINPQQKKQKLAKSEVKIIMVVSGFKKLNSAFKWKKIRPETNTETNDFIFTYRVPKILKYEQRKM